MDYLSGKQSQVTEKVKQEKVEVSKASFVDCFDSMFSALSSDKKVALCEKYLTKEFVEVLEDSELSQCIDSFFVNNLNISETSRNSFMHRNTLLYRIEKIHKMTGLNIKCFDDAMFFKLLFLLYSDTKAKIGKNGSKK